MIRKVMAFGLLCGMTSVASAAPPPNGADLFSQNCSACHQLTGKGIPGAFPALAGDKFVTGDPANPVKVVLHGRAGMPTFADSLDNMQIAAVLSYVRSSWGNKAPAVDPKLVAKLRGAATTTKQTPLQAH